MEILDIVRTKVLKFMIELEGEVGDVEKLVSSHQIEEVAPAIQNIFNTTVYGGTAIVASEAADVDSRTQTVIAAGDLDTLIDALHSKGIGNQEIAELQAAIDKDALAPTLEKKWRSSTCLDQKCDWA